MKENSTFLLQSKQKQWGTLYKNNENQWTAQEHTQKMDIAMGCCLLKCISDYKF